PAAAVLLAGNLKFSGSLLMQIQGDGPLELLVVECTHDLKIRTSVKLKEDDQPLPHSFSELANAHGKGRFAIILMQENTQLYQGIVPITGDNIAQMLEGYMKQSEQLDTRLWLSADSDRAAGFLLQKLPTSENISAQEIEETWNHACAIAQTIQSAELLMLNTDEFIHRLYWEDNLIKFEEQPVVFHCSCSRERVEGMLLSLGQEEVKETLQEQGGEINVNCHFCGAKYHFTENDCMTLFQKRS
ncbi:Hsp33 family molecular chaperone HslO, partial [Basilea psittacipulmonis]|uniref:Hsp33 family molecular chaperone HslO n=1 Tax=Basilea psittacipulmonis TaxID=1472345 RepID=UPI000986591B